MKSKIIISILIFAAVFTACEKSDVAPDLSATVNPAQVVSTLNDTLVVYAGSPIEFQLSGTPDLLTFFSGEAGRNYANRSRVTADGTPKLDFRFNSNGVTANQMDVLASTNFKGVYDSISIKAAKWDTITPPDMKAYVSTNVIKRMSTIDLSKYGGGQPVFIAYRLVIKSSATSANPTLDSMQVRNYQTDGIVTPIVPDFTTTGAGMSFVTLSENSKWKLKGSGLSLWKLNGTTITVNTTKFDDATVVSPGFGPTDGRTHELWAVSKVLYLNSILPDAGVTIKDITQALANYNYTYAKAGIYTVTFVGASLGNTGINQTTTKSIILKVINKI